MLKIPKDEASNASMRKYKQICMTHLVMAKCVSSIELAGILDLETVPLVRVQDKNSNFLPINMSLHSILIEITIPSQENPSSS